MISGRRPEWLEAPMEASRRSPNKLRLECALVCVVFFLTILGEARTFTLARNTGVSVAMLEGHCGRNPSKDGGHAFERVGRASGSTDRVIS